MKQQACPCTRCGPDLKQSWYEACIASIQHPTVGKDQTPSKQVTVRLFILLSITLVVILVIAVGATVFFSSDKQTQHMQRIAQLQYEQRHLTNKLSESEAMLALSDGQIESMQQELTRNNYAMHAMKQRLAMFDDVLAARKVGGWHILHPTAQWENEHSIAYHLVVVKGENYPRWAKGHLSFSVKSPTGETIPLDNKRGKRSLRFDMTTHAFFEGIIPWSKHWHADVLIISLFDKRGKNNQQIEIPILNKNTLSRVKLQRQETP